jgi:hypothetical protein
MNGIQNPGARIKQLIQNEGSIFSVSSSINFKPLPCGRGSERQLFFILAPGFWLFSVRTKSVDFGPRQGRRIFLTAGVVALRRGPKKSENAVLGQKMRFPFGHYLSSQTDREHIPPGVHMLDRYLHQILGLQIPSAGKRQFAFNEIGGH